MWIIYCVIFIWSISISLIFYTLISSIKLSILAISHSAEIASILLDSTSQAFPHISSNHFSKNYIYSHFAVINFLKCILIIQIYFSFVVIFVNSLLGFVVEAVRWLIFVLLLFFHLFLLRYGSFSFDLLYSFFLFRLVIIPIFLSFCVIFSFIRRSICSIFWIFLNPLLIPLSIAYLSNLSYSTSVFQSTAPQNFDCSHYYFLRNYASIPKLYFCVRGYVSILFYYSIEHLTFLSQETEVCMLIHYHIVDLKYLRVIFFIMILIFIDIALLFFIFMSFRFPVIIFTDLFLSV